MLALTSLWWLLFLTAVGLCIGSFLNAVIYRLPRNRSLRDPRWSFCPNCRHRISWYDNLPVLSFILLRGRCRHCAVPIATRYMIIELMMTLVVLVIVDAFFVGGVRTGLNQSVFGLTDQLSTDWPILLSHIVLFACLLSMSAIDIEHYWVDVRFTNFATLVGFGLHVLWTPKHSLDWVRPGDSLGVVSVLAIVGLGIAWLVSICWISEESEEAEPADTETAPIPVVEVSTPRLPPPPLSSPPRYGAWIACGLLVALLVGLWVDAAGFADLRHVGRAILPLLFFGILVAREGTVIRPADQEVADAIQAERSTARAMVLREVVYLLPALVGGVVGWWLMAHTSVGSGFSDAMHAKIFIPGIDMMRGWSPLLGLATAASGYIVAGGLGWVVRVVFTLLFGKEAFGVGDVHLMAAAGCVVGWPIVVLGFFLTCFLALVGWVVALPFKRSRALPLGPWLSLSFLIVVVFYDSIVVWGPIARIPETFHMLFLERPQFPMLEGIR